MSRSSISTSNGAALAHVVRRGLLFLAPVLLIGGFGELVLWRAREGWPPARVLVEWAKDPRTIYGPRFFTTNIVWIKGAMIREHRPQVITLGSSRVTQFRAPMFGPLEGSFYNAGHLVTGTSELEKVAALFLSGELPRPKAMIVGLDPWWMKIAPHRDQPESTSEHLPEASPTISAAAHLEALRLFFSEPQFPPTLLWPGTAVRDAAYGHNAIGLGALAGNGYRRDGSVLQTSMVQDYLRTRQYADRETPPVIERIRAHTHQFWVTEGLDWAQAERIVAVLRALRAAGMEVYVFLPPFSTEAETALTGDPALARWYAEYRTDLPQWLATEGFACANVRSPADFGMTDEAMMDGFHPGDVLMTHVLEALIRQAPPVSVLASIPVAGLQQLRQAPGVVPIALNPPRF